MANRRQASELRVAEPLDLRTSDANLVLVESAGLSALYGATAPGAGGGRFYGPGCLGGLAGLPAERKPYPPLPREDTYRMWEISEESSKISI